MTDKYFSTLWYDACKGEGLDKFIQLHNTEEYRRTAMPNKLDLDDALVNIYTVANMPLREIIESSGMKQTEISRHFCIPLRTIQGWCLGLRECPPYIRLCIAKELGILKYSADWTKYKEGKNSAAWVSILK